MTTLREKYAERLWEFEKEFEWNETDEAVRSLAVIGELLDLMFSEKEAALAMTALRRIINLDSRREWDWTDLNKDQLDTDWRKRWEEIQGWEESSQPTFIDQLHDLNAFANFGILPIWNLAGDKRLETEFGAGVAARLAAAQDLPTYIESICAKVDKLASLLNGSGIGETTVTRDQARARLSLDRGEPISLHALALLSGVTVKRIQNAIYAKTGEAPTVGENGLISPEGCEQWLNGRDFQWSFWKQIVAIYPLGADWGDDIPFENSEPSRLVDDYIFVPVANDGSYFHPKLRRKGAEKGSEGGFTIGPKGGEEVVADFTAALDQLSKMETPRWRRPNADSGIWGIVSGQTWKRIRRVDLEQVS